MTQQEQMNADASSPLEHGVMPHLLCWMIVDATGPTSNIEEFGIHEINGLSYDTVNKAYNDIFNTAFETLNDIEIPRLAFSAVLKVEDFSYENDDGWMMRASLSEFDLIPEQEA